MGNYVKISTLLFDELYRGLEEIELRNEVARLQEQLVARYVKNQKKLLKNKIEQASENELRELLEQDKVLNQLLKTSKEFIKHYGE